MFALLAEDDKNHQQQDMVDNTWHPEHLQHLLVPVAMSSQNSVNHLAGQHIQEMPFQLQELQCHQDAGPQIA